MESIAEINLQEVSSQEQGVAKGEEWLSLQFPH